MNQREPARPTTFASALLSGRQTAKLSQRELADRVTALGVKMDSSTLHRMEHGQREPKLSEALALSRLLHFDLAELSTALDAEGATAELLSHEAAIAVAALQLLGVAVIEHEQAATADSYDGSGTLYGPGTPVVAAAIGSVTDAQPGEQIDYMQVGLYSLIAAMDARTEGRFGQAVAKWLANTNGADDGPSAET